VNWRLFDGPLPGAGFTAITATVPRLAMAEGGITADSWLGLTNVAANESVPNCTVAPGAKRSPMSVRTRAGDPEGTAFGESADSTGTKFVIVSVLLAGRRMGAVAVIVTVPAVTPVAVNVALLCASGITTVAGRVTLPVPDVDSVTVKPPTSAGAADVTVNVNVLPMLRLAVGGVRLKAGGVSTVSVVSVLIEPEAAVMVLVPAANAEATPLALIVATT
jgi:hypothetical protein